MRRIVFLVIIGVIVVVSCICAGVAADRDPKEDFRQATDLMEAGKYAEAIPLLDRVLVAYPDDPSVLWNIGIATVEAGNHSRALDAWQRYRLKAPKDWRALAKIIQSYQALAQLDNRDAAREELLTHWKTVLSKEEKSPLYYCREQFSVAGRKVLALEYFDPSGPRRIYYRFSVTDSSGREDYYISLGSYDTTTEIARELGEIGNDQRAYHIDKYDGPEHKTFTHFNEEPKYDAVRKIVVNILQGNCNAISGSRKESQ
ncbi:tetratricopeptide repeat protein [bacterium]|nr:tetratricopeptide repeat protein [bacterium]